MEHLQIEKYNNTLLLTLPTEFRNDNWSIDFGEFQRLCRNIGTLTEFVIDASHCVWIDPIPIMSIIICLYELPVDISKKFYLRNRTDSEVDNMKVMAFLEKEGFLASIAASGTQLLIYDNGATAFYGEADRAEFLSYQNSLKFADATILPATITNLKVIAETETVESWLTNLLAGLRHRINNKLSGTIENEIYSN